MPACPKACVSLPIRTGDPSGRGPALMRFCDPRDRGGIVTDLRSASGFEGEFGSASHPSRGTGPKALGTGGRATVDQSTPLPNAPAQGVGPMNAESGFRFRVTRATFPERGRRKMVAGCPNCDALSRRSRSDWARRAKLRCTRCSAVFLGVFRVWPAGLHGCPGVPRGASSAPSVESVIRGPLADGGGSSGQRSRSIGNASC